MIRIENFAGPSPGQWETVLRGMRNPMNSWKAGDSFFCEGGLEETADGVRSVTTPLCGGCPHYGPFGYDAAQQGCGALKGTAEVFRIGVKDMGLAKSLISFGVPDRKFLRQLPVIMDITAPLYWWRQMSTYKIGTTADSCSQMHRLMEKPFDFDDFSADRVEPADTSGMPLDELPGAYDSSMYLWSSMRGKFEFSRWYMFVEEANIYPRDVFCILKDSLNYWRGKYVECRQKGDKRGMEYFFNLVLEFLPQSYNQKRTWSANYEVLRNICHQREGHKLKEWADFIEWVRGNVPYAEELVFYDGDGLEDA